MTNPVYTDPREPGAPGVGDMVVVVSTMAPGTVFADSRHNGTMRRVREVVDPRRYQRGWVLEESPAPAVGWWAYSVRRPTEAELAAWALEGGHG